jgi:glycosyltransferase involved in cell wall biosynthesis
MKIHGLSLVKNEADVLEETIVEACRWCDQIYVFDTGSADGTWELVRTLARGFPQVLPFKCDPEIYDEGLRADIFNSYRDRATEGDWWCRLDADEIYIDDPRVFLAKVPPGFNYVTSASFQYYFTDKDAQAYEADPQAFLSTPVQERLRYYRNNWGEPRFVRHDPRMTWQRSDGAWPRGMYDTLVYPVRIWVKHYPHRSPEQIERRLQQRRAAIERGNTTLLSEAVEDWSGHVVRRARWENAKVGVEFLGVRWQERVVPASSLCFDARDRRFEINEDMMPPLPVLRKHSPWRRLAGRGKRTVLRAAGLVGKAFAG